MKTERLTHAAVMLAARTLPARIRDRYREQWLADLRDAGEVGVHLSEIAIGALLFAATVARPAAPGFRRPTPAIVGRRGRGAVALALSSAALALTQYASIGGTGESLTGNDGYDYFAFDSTGLLAVYAIVAPIVALAIVSITRGTDARVRLAVWLLLPVGLAQFAERRIDSGNFVITWVYASPGVIAYLVALALTITAMVVVRHRVVVERNTSSRRSIKTAAVAGGFASAGVVASGILTAFVLWAGRTPLFFRAAVTAASRANYDQWVGLKRQGEQLVGSVLWDWALGGVSLALLVVVLGVRVRSVGSAIAVGMTGAFMIIVAIGALLGFLDLMDSGTVAQQAIGLLLFVGRCGIVGAILYGVGGRPALSRPGLRHVAATEEVPKLSPR